MVMVCCDAVENEQLVGDEKIHHGRLQFVMRRARHDGFDVVDEFVADEADRAAGEARQARHGHRAVFFHHALDNFEAVAHGRADLLVGLDARQRVLTDNKPSATFPFSMTSTRFPVCLMTARGLQPTNE